MGALGTGLGIVAATAVGNSAGAATAHCLFSANASSCGRLIVKDDVGDGELEIHQLRPNGQYKEPNWELTRKHMLLLAPGRYRIAAVLVHNEPCGPPPSVLASTRVTVRAGHTSKILLQASGRAACA